MGDLKHKPVCTRCGSDNVTADCPMTWCTLTQGWVTAGGAYDGGHCSDCDEDMKHFDWVEVKP